MNLVHPTWDAELPSEQGTLRAVRLAQHAGAARLAANLYEIERSGVVSPLHFHHANEELLFVLSGTPTLRRGHGEERTLTTGEVVAFLPGPSGTHQIVNHATEPARVLIVATNDLPEVAEQPENEQMAIITRRWPAAAATRPAGHRGTGVGG
ncbi:MAG: cupin domain-containing protein [Actinomycetota bacterium]|nr:cupin domain-containing protein [Actinomycetota bacterium]